MRTFESDLAALRDVKLLRELRPLSGRQGVKVRCGGADLINFSSNDYLGLATHPRVTQFLAQAVGLHGAGAAGSRLICGTLDPHGELEDTLARLEGTEAALSFSSGYAAAVGTLTGLLRKGDVVILDKLAHASLIDGARLSGATVRIFPHNDVSQLDRRLEWAGRAAGADGRVLVVTEAVFSMDGDRAPLREIVETTQRHGALLLVDEAHSFGLFGRDGRGLVDDLGLGAGVDFHFGTLSKAVGLAGGYVAGRRSAIEVLINRARSFVFSTAPPPALAATAAFVVRELLSGAIGREARATVWRHARRFSTAVGRGDPSSPIVPVIVGSEAGAMRMAAALQDRGFLVPAIRFPTVPHGRARLRVTLSASHSDEQVDGLIDAMQAVSDETDS